MREVDQKYNLYFKDRIKHREGNVLDLLNGFDFPDFYSYRIKIVYSRKGLQNVVNSLVERGHLKAITSQLFEHSSTIGRARPENVKVWFLLLPLLTGPGEEQVQAIVTIGGSNQWKVLSRFIKNAYPRFVPVLLSKNELIECAKTLQSGQNEKLIVTSVSYKEKLRGASKTVRKSIREWTQEELDVIINRLQGKSHSIGSLDIELNRVVDGRLKLVSEVSTKIRHNGELEVKKGFKTSFEKIAKKIAVTGLDKLTFLSNRGLRETNYSARPLSIEFQQPIFDKLPNIRKLVRSLENYPNSLYTIKHGNPYAHTQVTDLLDGSSFEVWSLSPKRIVIIPGLKTTEGALDRVSHYLFDVFREGTITNYGEDSTREGEGDTETARND